MSDKGVIARTVIVIAHNCLLRQRQRESRMAAKERKYCVMEACTLVVNTLCIPNTFLR